MTVRVIRIRSKAIGVAVGVGVLVAAVVIGPANTPYLDGRAVVLTRERMAMMRGLRDLSGWTDAVVRELDVLEGIVEETAANPDSGRLLEGGQRGAEALRRLTGVARRVDGARMPEAMRDLQEQAREALGYAIVAGRVMLGCVGAPQPEKVGEARKRLKEAREALEELDGRVQKERGALWR